jgi:ribonuclease Z
MLLNREKDLLVYGPKGIKEIILLQLRASGSYTGYNLYFHELQSTSNEILYEDDKVRVSTIPLHHRVYTNGFLFQEKNKERKLNIPAITELEIEPVYFRKIQYGGDITLEDGRVISNAALTFDPTTARSYAYCSDTCYDERIIPLIQGVDLLYHESTFLDNESHLAERTMHATAKQAASIALQAKVHQLLLGHFSTRYGSTEPFKAEAETIFPQVWLAEDGKEFEIPQR